MGYFAKIKKGDVVLELGSGYPLYKIYSGKVGDSGTFVSLDYRPKIQKRSKKIPDWINNLSNKDIVDREGLVVADVKQLPFADDSFDVIIASNLTEDSMEEWLKESLRTLRPGGSVTISFYEIAGLPLLTSLISQKLNKIGFRNIKLRVGMPGIGGLNWFVIAEK